MKIQIMATLMLFLATGCTALNSPYANLQPEEAKERLAEMSQAELFEGIGWHGWNNENKGGKEVLKKEVLRRNSQWDAAVKQDVLAGFVKLGMTKNQVLASWGKPQEINRTVFKEYQREQWVYQRGYQKGRYIYFVNDKVDSWQS